MDAGCVELLQRMLEANDASLQDVAAAIFTLDDDLAGENPAAAARSAGWELVPLLMVREHGADARVPRCLRVLLLVNTTRSQAEVRHVYLRDAAVLRPDLTPAPLLEATKGERP
jgi:chorismate mutase